MNLRHTSRTLIATIALVGGLAVTATPAAVAKDTDAIRRGSCTLGATWKLKASPENGRIEVNAEVDSNRVGQKWTVVLRQNGTTFSTSTQTTVAPSGSFTVRRIRTNLPGKDVFALRATNPATGEVCSGSVTYTG